MLNKRGQEVKHIKEDDLKRIREFLKLKNKVVLLNSSVQKSLKELKIYYRSIGYSSTEGYIFKSLSRCNKKYLIDSPLIK